MLKVDLNNNSTRENPVPHTHPLLSPIPTTVTHHSSYQPPDVRSAIPHPPPTFHPPPIHHSSTPFNPQIYHTYNPSTQPPVVSDALVPYQHFRETGYIPKLKLEFPIFTREDVEGWMYTMEQMLSFITLPRSKRCG